MFVPKVTFVASSTKILAVDSRKTLPSKKMSEPRRRKFADGRLALVSNKPWQEALLETNGEAEHIPKARA